MAWVELAQSLEVLVFLSREENCRGVTSGRQGWYTGADRAVPGRVLVPAHAIVTSFWGVDNWQTPPFT